MRRTMRIAMAAGIALSMGAFARAGEALTMSLEDAGAHRVFVEERDAPALAVRGPAGVTVDFSVTDATGNPLPDALPPVALDGEGNARVVPPARRGYYLVSAAPRDGGKIARLDYAVVPAQAPGARPESFFASNTSGMKLGTDLELLNRLGIRVQRVHFQPRVDTKRPLDGTALPADFDELDRQWKEVRESGSWILPLVGYALHPEVASEAAQKSGMHGPPRDNDEFCATWRLILERYPEITTYEFWNEPWIFSWTWAATPAEYRVLQRQWLDMAHEVNPALRLIAGNSSMFTEDHIEAYPESWQGRLHGTTHHPYMNAGYPSFRRGGMARSIDHGMAVTRRMGLPYYYLTEGGTEYRDLNAFGHPRNNLVNARKVVHYHVHTALVGTYQANMQWDIGYGPDWTLPNAVWATMTQFLEDRPVVADVWPHNSLITGAIFAHPRHIDDAVRALPRAGELSARWDVPVSADRADDALKVAVLHSFTGASSEEPDRDATLTLAPRGDFRAFDLVGREIAPDGDRLVLPFGENPVYVTTSELSVAAFHQRLATAAIADATPVNVSASSLTLPADQPQSLRVRVDNALNRPLAGTVSIRPIESAGVVFSAPFQVEAGRLAEVPVPWGGVARRDDNRYGVTVRVETDAGTVERTQLLSVARFTRRTATVDAQLDDWRDATPVLLDSAALKGGLDLTRYLLNPSLERPTTGDGDDERVVARVWTAYDDEFVYLAAAIDEKTFANKAGAPIKLRDLEIPYREGLPGGLNHVYSAGDSLSFSFGFRDRVPGWGRTLDDPWAWKGHFHDSDYHYIAHSSTDGPLLIRQWGPDTPRRTGYQTVSEPWMTPVAGAQVAIRRDEAAHKTYYEMALPRTELSLFDPAAGSLRFSFQLHTDKRVNGSGTLRWGEAAGLFDYWWNSGSFAPSWEENLPCQTFFGIEPPAN